ncbi:Rad1/Rec1/Rad17 [Cyathus striatus]|nr:Rad1/Rec1/Rad17 [Cyathus striatus]
MPEDAPLVLSASLHDIRYFTSLLRGVNFTNRATVIVTDQGLTITVEEARTLLGTAFIFANIFDEYKYNHESDQTSQRSLAATDEENESDESNTTFEIPLNTLIDCLNIFGTAGAPSTSASTTATSKKWRKAEEGSNGEDGGRGDGGGIDAYFTGGSDKKTGMRMSYAGSGYPLTLLIAEEVSGPTTICEITTFAPEPHLDLSFDNSRMVLKFILKSSWLRDALSELDPSCEKLTFIGNPPQDVGASNTNPRQRTSKPILRIQAVGTFGSTEMDYPNDRDVLETFECTRPVNFSYRFSHISKALKALQSSTKTSLRIDDEGLLSLQFLMPSPRPRGTSVEGADGFIDFNCLALDDEL